jgi:tetratricopeptide (TPR) repeat protein
MKRFENLKIKSLKIVVLLIVISTKVYANADASAQAEKQYSDKKFKEAIEIYEQILAQQNESDKLYFNLGNCYLKTNQIGKAIYNYELAAKLNPKDDDITVNLKIANSKTIDKIDNKENYFIGALKSSIANYYSTTSLAWISIFSLIISLSLLLLFILSKSILLKRLGFIASVLSFCVFVCAMLLGYFSLNLKKQTHFAIILSHEVKIHTEPNDLSDSKFSLHEGTKVSVLNQSDKWLNIKLENGNEGWVKSNYAGLF